MTALVRGAFGSAQGPSWHRCLHHHVLCLLAWRWLWRSMRAYFNIGGRRSGHAGRLRCRPGGAMVVGRTACLGDAAADGAGQCPHGTAWAAIPPTCRRTGAANMVISTIMFNSIASNLLVYVLVNHFATTGPHGTESAALVDSAHLPGMRSAGLGGGGGRFAAERQFAVGAGVCQWGCNVSVAHAHGLPALAAPATAAGMWGIRPQRQALVAMAVSGAPSGPGCRRARQAVAGVFVRVPGSLAVVDGAETTRWASWPPVCCLVPCFRWCRSGV